MRDADPLELITRYLDGSITAENFAALNDALANDDALRRHFIGLTYTAQLMTENLNPQFGEAHELAFESIPSPMLRRRRSVGVFFAAVALIALAVTAWFVFLPEPRTLNPEPSRASHVVATVTSADEHVVWTSAPLHPGQDIAAQTIAIETGTAEFVLASGTAIQLQGPTQLTIHDPMHATLVRGIATFDCPPQAIGYTVNLPGGGRVVDLGTRFRVSTDSAGHAEVYVITGRVRLENGQAMELAAGWVGRIADQRMTMAPAGELVDAGFEGSYEPADAPDVTLSAIGRWTGDPAAAVGIENDIAPIQGRMMLRFDATHVSPSHLDSRIGQIYQLIDLTARASEIEAGDVTVEFSVAFNRVSGDARTDTRFGARVVALPRPTGTVFTDAAGMTGPDRVTAEIATDADPTTWQRLDCRLTLPPNARYLLVELRAIEDQHNDSAAPEFAGHFADDARLTFSASSSDAAAPTTNIKTNRP